MEREPYKPGRWVFLGSVLGAFVGLVFGKLVLGAIFGFFLGLVIDAGKRKAAGAPEGGDAAKAEEP